MRPWLLTALLALASCIRPSKVVGVACEADADCVLPAVAGSCEATGYCSYPDTACESGQRYSPGAGDGLGGACVGSTLTCGGQDEPCCGSVCGANLACGATMTCRCGGDGEPCCDGTTCGDSLACGPGAICACGGIGEPCCGGATCDDGLTCGGGTCLGGATQIAVGAGHACALRPDRTVWCWGNDWKPWAWSTPGLLSTTIASTTPVRIAIDDVAEVRAAEMHTCARRMDGTLWCWGHNEVGQLGVGSSTSTSVPAPVTGLSNVTLFDGGRHHTCALGSYNGTQGLWCWGRNSKNNRNGGNPDAAFGRLGNNTVVDAALPVAVDLAAATAQGASVRALATGSYHSCAALSDNTVWCWGKNSDGQLGTGNTTSSKVPVAVNLAGIAIPGDATIDEVTCSDGSGYQTASTCLRLSTGAVYCWGAANVLGDGSTTARSAPTAPVTTSALGGATFVQLASAVDAHCAVTTAGDVWCWGSNHNGVLGVNSTSSAARTTPVKTTVLTGAVQLDMSHRTACAVDSEQRLFCWGTNRRGQTIGAPPRVFQPTRVPL
jgi:alpha-tubulin suppressor-like RCC1 family protein